MGRLDGKTALVTGGTAGIGRGIVDRLLADGAVVFLCSRKQANVDEALGELQTQWGADRVSGMACNVGDLGAQEALVETALGFFGAGRIDILVPNAAVNPRAGPSLEMEDAIFDKIFNVNLKSYWQLVKLVRPSMQSGGSIVLISSVGAFQPAPPLGLYGVSKTALVALGRVLAAELGPANIRVNTICPGIIKTKMSQMLWADKEDSDLERGSSLLQRFGTAHEIGTIAAFLCSEDAAFITGESIVANGGGTARL